MADTKTDTKKDEPKVASKAAEKDEPKARKLKGGFKEFDLGKVEPKEGAVVLAAGDDVATPELFLAQYREGRFFINRNGSYSMGVNVKYFAPKPDGPL